MHNYITIYGRIRTIRICKTASGMFFTNDKNDANNVTLKNLDFKITTFTGTEISSVLKDGASFTLPSNGSLLIQWDNSFSSNIFFKARSHCLVTCHVHTVRMGSLQEMLFWSSKGIRGRKWNWTLQDMLFWSSKGIRGRKWNWTKLQMYFLSYQ